MQGSFWLFLATLTSVTGPPAHPDGLPFLGYAHRCIATVGEGDMAVAGTLDTDLDGNIANLYAESALHRANPNQMVAKGQKSATPWTHIGTLYCKLSWVYIIPNMKQPGQPWLRNDLGYIYFELHSER